VKLLDLFDGRRQLVLYHFMFAPDVQGWPDAAAGCSFFADQVSHPSHLNARDTSMAFVRARRSPTSGVQEAHGVEDALGSSAGNDFTRDFGVTPDKGETFGLSVFLRDGSKIYRTYFTNGRDEALGST